MDLLTFWDHFAAHIVGLLSAYAWPLVVFAVLLSQRAAVAGFIKAIAELKFTWGDKQASVAMNSLTHAVDVAEAVTAEKKPEQLPAPAVDAPVHVVPPAFEEDRDLEEEPGMLVEPEPGSKLELQAKRRLRIKLEYLAPSIVIERAWVGVRAAVFQLLGLNTAKRRYFDMDSLPDEQLISKLKADPRVEPALLRAIVELKMVRNDAVNTIGWQPNGREADEYVLNAQRVIAMVEAAGKKPDA